MQRVVKQGKMHFLMKTMDYRHDLYKKVKILRLSHGTVSI